MTGSRLKVYGWTTHTNLSHGERFNTHHRQARAIVATPSFAAASRAAEAVGFGRLHRDYCAVTGDKRELEVALAEPGVVFASPLHQHPPEYLPLSSRPGRTAA